MEFIEAIKNRRTIYAINKDMPVSDEKVEHVVKELVLNVPSAFNSQTARVVVAFGNYHQEIWDIVKEELHKQVPEDKWEGTDNKVAGFAAGYGTILYFEDMDKVSELQESFPLYANNFPIWSNQSSGMLQFAIWTALEELGLGANLQHYNPLIDEKIHEYFNLPKSWKLMAQMPFGGISSPADEKEFDPIEDRLFFYR